MLGNVGLARALIFLRRIPGRSLGLSAHRPSHARGRWFDPSRAHHEDKEEVSSLTAA